MSAQAGCPLCEGAGGRIVFEGGKLRVIHAQDADFPGFYRVVWRDHVAEFSDLDEVDRAHCMQAVVEVERALREHLLPDKINLAALGNMVPHLHWHVIARFRWDSRFHDPVWCAPVRQAPAERLAEVTRALPALERDLVTRLQAHA